MTAAPLPQTVDEAVSFVHRCDLLPFPARSRAVALAARGLRPTVFEQVHARLDAGEPDERHAALFLAVVRRDLGRVEAAMADPLLQRRALAAAIRLPVPDAALARLVRTGPPAVRRAVYGVLRRSRRRGLADALLPEIARFGDAEVAALLPACSPAVVERRLPEVPASSALLRTLARTAPPAVARRVTDRPAGQEDGRFLRVPPELVTVLADRSVAAALLLFERCPQQLTPAATAVALRRPERLLEIVRRTRPTGVALPARPLPRATTAALRRCTPAELVELSAACTAALPHRRREEDPLAADPLVALLPPGERLRVATDALTSSLFPESRALLIFAALDPADRSRLLADLRTRGTGFSAFHLLPYAPLPAVQDELLARATSPRHTMRKSGWPALLRCAQRHGDPVAYARVLELAERAWHDREAVRTRAFEQAARTPVGLLGAVPPSVLREATAAALQFGDTTRDTVAALAGWLHRTVRWALDDADLRRAAELVPLLCAAVTARYRVPVRPLGVDVVTAVALDALLADRIRRPVEVTALGQLLGPALPGRLDARLEGIWRDAADPVAPAAARAWLADPATRADRAERVLPAGPVVGELAAITATRRTDLVDQLLDRLPGDPARVAEWLRAVPPGAPGRWTAARRRRWDGLLAGIAADQEVPFAARGAAAARIADTDLLLPLCRSDAQPVAAAALAALADRAAPDRAMTELLLAVPLAGARGRAALAGVRRLLDRLPEDRALALCSGVLLDPRAGVGARKAAARAATGIGLPAEVLGLLHAAWDLPDLHRDVRIAVARCLLRFVGRPGTAERLSAHLTDRDVRAAVFDASVTAYLGKAERAAYVRLVVEALWHPEVDVRGGACDACAHLLGPTDSALPRIAELLVDPAGSHQVWRSCFNLLLWRSGTPAGVAAWHTALELISDLPVADARQHLAVLAAEATFRLPVGHLDALVTALTGAALPGAAAACAQQAAVYALGAGDTGFPRWQRFLDLVGDRLQRMPPLAAYNWTTGPTALRIPDADLQALLDRLDASGAPAAGYAAVAVVQYAGRRSEWPPYWMSALRERQAVVDPDLAELAWSVDVRDRRA